MNTSNNTQINNNITFTDNRGRIYNVNESYDNLLYIHELMCAKYISGDYNGHTKEVFESMIEEVEMKLKTMLLSGYGFNPNKQHKQMENNKESNMQDYLHNEEYEAAHQELMSLLDQANDHEFEMANELSHAELYEQIMEDNNI